MEPAIRILVVDDDKPIQEFLYDALTNEGYQVTIASDSLMALELAPAVQPTLIILDIMMPYVDGMTFLELYHRLAVVFAPILVVSASLGFAERAMQLGAVDALVKPFDLEELLALIEKYAPARSA